MSDIEVGDFVQTKFVKVHAIGTTHAGLELSNREYVSIPLTDIVPPEKEKTDRYGRVWMHCESGLSMTKASMGRFVAHALENRIEIGQIWAFNPSYQRSLVCVTIRLKPEQFEAFERETGGKLRKPPVVHLSSFDASSTPNRSHRRDG